jgi:hypothetical protein
MSALHVSVLLNCLDPFPGCSARLHPDRDHILSHLDLGCSKVGQDAADLNVTVRFRLPYWCG